MARRTVIVQVTAEIEDFEVSDFADRLADAAKHECDAYWAYTTLESSTGVEEY